MAEQDNLLSTEELDALVSESKDELDVGGLGFKREGKELKYDIASEAAFLNFNLDAVHRIHQALGKKLQQDLKSAFRSEIAVEVKTAELVSFDTYAGLADTTTATNVISMEPLRGQALVVIEIPVILSALSSFFGGTGLNKEANSINRQFTATEMTIKNIILNSTLGSIHEAWAPILSLTPVFIGLETELANTKITSSLNSVCVNRFSITIAGNYSGSIDIVYPYSMLRLMSSKLTQWSQGSIKKESSQSIWRSSLNAAVSGATVEITVELGQINLTLKEFELLREEEVVVFNKPPLARASVAGIPIFEGTIGSQASQMALQVVRSFKAPK